MRKWAVKRAVVQFENCLQRLNKVLKDSVARGSRCLSGFKAALILR